MKKILINASNLHVGGGVQVAASFIYELSKLINNTFNYSISVVISTEVLNNLPSDFSFNSFSSLEEVNLYGFKHNDKRLFGYDVLFTIFGPLYIKTDAKYEVTGFAQAWIAYPNNLAFKRLSLLNKIKSLVIYNIKEFFFKKSDFLIVEADHVKDALILKGYDDNKIFVVNNTVSSVFNDDSNRKIISYIKKENFTLGFIGRNYTHKNIKILKEVNKVLIERYSVVCDFLFTLTDQEMDANEFSIVENFYSVGPISVEQCPNFYNEIDALIFPSLLECFSATPIEAMKMGKLVIASNLPFVTDVCKSSARYFDPLSAESIALAIYSAINEPEKNQEMIINAKKLVDNLPTAKDRAEAYLDILLNIK